MNRFVGTFLITLLFAASALAGGAIDAPKVESLVKNSAEITELAKRDPKAALEKLASAGILNIDDAVRAGAARDAASFKNYLAETLVRSNDSAIVEKALRTLGVKFEAKQISALEINTAANSAAKTQSFSQLGNGNKSFAQTKPMNADGVRSKSTSAKLVSGNVVEQGVRATVDAFAPNGSMAARETYTNVVLATGKQVFLTNKPCDFNTKATDILLLGAARGAKDAMQLGGNWDPAIAGAGFICEVGQGEGYKGDIEKAAKNLDGSFTVGGHCERTNPQVLDVGAGAKLLQARSFDCQAL